MSTDDQGRVIEMKPAASSKTPPPPEKVTAPKAVGGGGGGGGGGKGGSSKAVPQQQQRQQQQQQPTAMPVGFSKDWDVYEGHAAMTKNQKKHARRKAGKDGDDGDEEPAVVAKYKVGDMLEGQFSEDLQWYRARIDEVHRDGTYEVYYVDYGNAEHSEDQYLRPISAKPAPTPAPAPVRTVSPAATTTTYAPRPQRPLPPAQPVYHHQATPRPLPEPLYQQPMTGSVNPYAMHDLMNAINGTRVQYVPQPVPQQQYAPQQQHTPQQQYQPQPVPQQQHYAAYPPQQLQLQPQAPKIAWAVQSPQHSPAPVMTPTAPSARPLRPVGYHPVQAMAAYQQPPVVTANAEDVGRINVLESRLEIIRQLEHTAAQVGTLSDIEWQRVAQKKSVMDELASLKRKLGYA